MDVGNRNGWKLDEVVSAAEIVSMIDAELPLEPAEPQLRRRGGEIAGVTRDGSGENRRHRFRDPALLRQLHPRPALSTDGKLYTCLFATDGVDLRGPMRQGASDTELSAIIAGAWSVRRDRYSEERTELTTAAAAARAPRSRCTHIGG